MSWLKGMQWKTPWRRRRPQVPPTTLTNVWAFVGFQDPNGDFAQYELPLVTPAPGRALPFWIGGLFIVTDPPVTGSGPFLSNNDGAAGLAVSVIPVDTVPGIDRQATFSLTQAPALNTNVVKPGLGSAFQAVAFLIQAEAISGTQYVVNYWVDRFLAAQVLRTLPFTATGAIFSFSPMIYGLNGIAAGNSVLTNAEIYEWFDDTKAQAEVRPIAGKTSDRWTATSAQPLVPDPLPNIGGGQAADFVNIIGVPTVANTLLSVAFGY